MKTKHYSVSYSAPVIHEAVIQARSKKEAAEKVIEVIGDPIIIEDIYVLKTKTGNAAH